MSDHLDHHAVTSAAAALLYLPDLLNHYRTANSASLRDVATASGVSYGTVLRLERHQDVRLSSAVNLLAWMVSQPSHPSYPLPATPEGPGGEMSPSP